MRPDPCGCSSHQRLRPHLEQADNRQVGSNGTRLALGPHSLICLDENASRWGDRQPGTQIIPLDSGPTVYHQVRDHSLSPYSH